MTQPDDDKTQTHVTLTKGTMVPHYLIIEKIGAGGMGEVYLAEDTELNRKVALKFLPPHLCQDADCRARFKREAQAAAKLNHPNIITIHEVSEFHGRPFFVMEHLEGRTLREFSADRELSLEQILELGIQICEGLNAAHEKGVTHRDIKPSNILIDSHGRVKVVDFGLAAVIGANQLTKTGSTMGTVGYMSPEQVQGKAVDHRSDLFSLGVVLYELMTGQNPFKRESEAATLKAVSDDTPHPVARYRSEVPPGLQSIVDKALEKDVKTRYQHSDEMLSDLMRVKRPLELSQSAFSPKVRSSRLWWVTGALVVVAASVTLFVIRPWVPDTISGKPDKLMLAVLPFENLGNPEDEYFADGMTEEIISRLASVSSLGVISRTSIMSYKNTDKPLSQIGQELGVEYILEGTVRFDKNSDPPRVRITPQLIRVADDVHLWADQLDMPLDDVFKAQSQIAHAIVTALDVRLVQGEPEWLDRVPTRSTEAFQLMLQARHIAYEGKYGREETRDTLIAVVQRALEYDSSLVLAWAVLSTSHSAMYHYGYDKTPGRLTLAETAARRAVGLDTRSPEAHYALGIFYYSCLRDYNRALTEFEFVLEAPRCMFDPTIYVSYILRRQGRLSEAVERQLKYFRMNPRSSRLAYEIGVTYQAMGKYDKAQEFLVKAITLDPEVSHNYGEAAANLRLWKSDLEAAHAILERMPQRLYPYFWKQTLWERDRDRALALLDSVDYQSPIVITQYHYFPVNLMRALTHRWLGDGTPDSALFEDARQVLVARLQETPEDFRVNSALGVAYAGLGRKTEALRHANRAVELCPLEQDALLGLSPLMNRIGVQMLLKDYEAALDGIERFWTLPASGAMMSVPMLKTHPLYDPLRQHPRFQKLVGK